MRRTRYAATAGSALAVTGVAVLVASWFGGGNSPEAAPGGGATRPTSAAPATPHIPVNPPAQAGTTTAPPTPASHQETMSRYYDTWKTCPTKDLTVGPLVPGVTLPPTSTKVWVDACQRMVSTLSALHPGADVSPAPSSWQILDNSRPLPPPAVPGRDEPVPAGLTPNIGPSMYRVQDAKGTVVLAFHSADSHESDQPDGSTSVGMTDGLRAWFAPPTRNSRGVIGGGEFYVENAKGHDAYVLLMQAPPTFTTDDFKALVTNPKFEHMMAENLAEPNF
ncbi:MAG: hypothetical protein HOW97_15640 [Catenulispora sp.]|nr:hypothetical protein [Catenulispora sp.]